MHHSNENWGEMCLIKMSQSKIGFLFIMHNIIPFVNVLLILGWNVAWTCFMTFLCSVCVCVYVSTINISFHIELVRSKSYAFILCIQYITDLSWHFIELVLILNDWFRLCSIESSLDLPSFFYVVIQYKLILIPLSVYI